MATTEYQLGRGAQIKVKVGEAYLAIPGVEDFDGPDMGCETEELVTHETPGMSLEFVPVSDKDQTLEFAMVWDPTPDTAQEALRDAAESTDAADKELDIQYIPVGSDGWSATALLKGYKRGNPTKGVIKIDVALQKTGDWTPLGS